MLQESDVCHIREEGGGLGSEWTSEGPPEVPGESVRRKRRESLVVLAVCLACQDWTAHCFQPSGEKWLC